MKTAISLFIYVTALSAVVHSQINIDSILKEIEITQTNDIKANLYIDLALILREQSSDSAFIYFDKAASHFDTTAQSILRTRYYYHLAEVYLDIGNHDAAWVALTKAKTNSVSDKSLISTASILDKKADVKIRNGEYQEAMSLLMKALPIFEKNKDLVGLGEAYNSLGTIMERTKRLDSALDYYTKAYTVSLEVGNIRPANGYLANMAIIHSMRGNHNLAVPLFKKVIAYAEENNEKRIEAIASGNLGRAYVMLNTLDSAEIFISKSLSIFKSMGHGRGQAAASSQLARVYVRQGKNRETINLLLPQYDFVKAHRFVIFEGKIIENLIDAYKNLGDFENAYLMTHNLMSLKDSTVTKEMAIAVNEAETKYESQKKQAEINKLAYEDTINRTKINQQRTALWSLLAVVSLLSYLFYRLFRQKKEIEYQSKEKEILLREIHHRVKNNLQVISSLLKLQSKNVSDLSTQKVLKEGQSRVRSMALIHQNLYQDNNLTGIYMPTYIKELTTELIENYSNQNKEIKVNLDIDNIDLDVDTVVPIGLIINELITNSLKYAFSKTAKPMISVLLQNEESGLRLLVSDNGAGFDSDQIKKGSLGMKLIHSFAKRLKADFEFKSTNGTVANLLIKDYTKIGEL